MVDPKRDTTLLMIKDYPSKGPVKRRVTEGTTDGKRKRNRDKGQDALLFIFNGVFQL